VPRCEAEHLARLYEARFCFRWILSAQGSARLELRANRMDLKLPLLESVLPAQRPSPAPRHSIRHRAPRARIGVFGLAFKENTDDLRESPVVTLIEFLLGKGRELRIYDPHIRLEESTVLTGSLY